MDNKQNLLDQMKGSMSSIKSFNGKRVLNIEDEEIKFWKPVEGDNHIDILQYVVGTDKHPGNREKGSLSYVLDLWQHNNIGINKSSFLCLQRTYGQPCPICEEAQRRRSKGDKKGAEALYASHRVFYNIIDLEDEDSGVQIFGVSYNLFEKELLDEAFANQTEDGQGIILFADLEEGYSITVRARGVSKNINGKIVNWFEYRKFNFEKRQRNYDPAITLKRTYSLDSLLYIPTYEEITEEFKGKSIEDAKEETPKVSVCPHDNVFGKDFENFMECEACVIWRDCKKANREAVNG